MKSNRKEILRKIKQLEERFFHGAQADQKRFAFEYLPKISLSLSEAERAAGTIRQNWYLRNAEWGEAIALPPGGSIPLAEPSERSEDSRLADVLRRLGTAASGIEAITAGYAAQFWVDLPPFQASAVGVVVAGVYTYLAKSLWAIGYRDHSNHWPEFKRRERMLWRLGTACVGVLGSIGIVRFFPVPEWVYFLQLGALSVLLPLFAAGCFVLARHVSERNRLSSEYWKAQSLISRLQTLLSRIKEVLAASDEKGGLHA